MDGLDGPVVLLGATGTIGRAVAAALRARGVAVRAPGRDGGRGAADYAGARAVVSCMASRSGVAADAWAVDYRAHLAALDAAKAAQVPRFLQLSAICLQKPRLTFQHAKLAFEAELRASGLSWTIVRPTAYFKSLSGQVPRVLGGKPFLVFGDGEMTATKPISDRDLAAYLVDCLADPATARCVLPVGGPGPAVTPRAQGEMIFAAAGLTPRFRHVSPRLLPTIARGMAMIGTVVPPLAPKAELARIGAYYGTESMLVWDAARRRYDADATPEVGRDRLCDHFSAMVSGALDPGLGAHAVF